MIYARPRPPQVRLAAAVAGLAVAAGAAAGIAVFLGAAGTLVAGLAGGAAGAALMTGWFSWRLLRWPPARLCLFRDRILVVRGRTATAALWDKVTVATLAVSGPARGVLPEVKLGNRLTLVLEAPARPVTLRPADFGLEPVACRDLLLRLRDDPDARARLPEFDSALDLRGRPVTAGERHRSG